MTTERTFERIAQAWLEAGPAEAPDRVIAAVLETAASMPQARRSRRRTFGLQRLRFATAIAILVAVALGAAYLVGRNNTTGPLPSPSPTAQPSGLATATVGPTPSESPIPTADLVIANQQIFAWEGEPGSGFVDFQEIVEVLNQGPGWAKVTERVGSTNRILDSKGNLSSSEKFHHFVPQFLGPGETGYFIAGGTTEYYTIDQFGSVDAELTPAAYQSVLAPTGGTIEVTDVSWQPAGTRLGVKATGTVIDNGPKGMAFAYVVVFCFGTTGAVLGYTSVTVENLAIGVPQAFETATYGPPVDPSDCTSFKGFVLEGVNQN